MWEICVGSFGMYLVRRHRKWWALHDLPPALHPVFGVKRLAESLGTELEAEARRRADFLWLHRWSREIEKAKAAVPATLDEIEKEARFWQRLILSAKTEEEKEALTSQVADLARERAEKAAEQAGIYDLDDPKAEEIPGVSDALKLVGLVTGKMVPLTDHLEAWLATSSVSPKTKDMQASDVRRLAAALPLVLDVTPAAVQKWVYRLAQAEELSAKTIQRVLSALRGYWTYLGSVDVVPKDVKPFADLSIPTINKTAKRRPFTPEDVVKLRKEAGKASDQKLKDLITLAMWTGARLEELCALPVKDVDLAGRSFSVADSKTEAGVRVAPIHSELVATMGRLAASSTDGFILSGLPVDQYGDRGAAIGKRFGRLKTRLGYGPEVVFHSIRKTVATLLENALVPENVAADIIGHDKPRITYGLYSGGSSLLTMAEAIEKVRYPD